MAHPSSKFFQGRNFLYVLLLALPAWPIQAGLIINVNPSMNWYQIVKDATGTLEEPTTIYFEEGVYEDASEGFIRLNVGNYVNIEGHMGAEDMHMGDINWTPTTSASTVMRNGLRMTGVNEVSNIIFEANPGNPGLSGIGERFNVHDNYFLNITEALILYPTNATDTLVNSCTFYACHNGILNALGSSSYGYNSRIRENKFVECAGRAIYTAKGLNIGSATEPGNNIFYKNNLNIRNELGGVISGQGNLWYDSDGIVLTEEADIQATFEYIDAKKGLSENIFLYPWYFSFIRYQNGLLGEPPASVEHWRAFR